MFKYLQYLAVSLLLLSANSISAQSNALGWCTVVLGGPAECFPDPMSACYRQYQSYANPLNAFEGYLPYHLPSTPTPHIRLCDWVTPTEGGAATILPTTIFFQCNANYSFVPPNNCVPSTHKFKERPLCNSYGGGSPNPSGDTNPIILSTGSKYHRETDFSLANGEFAIERHYRSRQSAVYSFYQSDKRSLGLNWNFSFDYSLHLPNTFTSISSVTLFLPDGSSYDFQRQASGVMVPTGSDAAQTAIRLEFIGSWPTTISTLTSSPSQWKVTLPDNQVVVLETSKIYGNNAYVMGKPLSISERNNHQLNFTYGSLDELTSIVDSYGRTAFVSWNIQDPSTYSSTAPQRAHTISRIDLPDGTALRYYYSSTATNITIPFDFPERLIKVEYLDTGNAIVESKQYLYENSAYPFALTGIIDGLNNRVATWTYDSEGRAISSEGANAQNQYSVSYSDNSLNATRVVTNPLLKQATYTFNRLTTLQDTWRLQTIVGQPSPNCVGSTKSYTYNAQGFVSSKVDSNGSRTDYLYDTFGRITQRKEAATTPLERIINTVWHPSWWLPTQIVAPRLTTDYSYDTNGNLLTLTETDTSTHSIPYSTNGQTRTWSYTYGAFGKRLTETGPRTDVTTTTTYTYDQNGNVATVTDPLNHHTQINSYSDRGLPLSLTDANGVLNTMTYNARGLLLSLTVHAASGNATTTFAYNSAQLLSSITLPDGSSLNYTYDNSQRLVAVENSIGERIEYDLNLLGNITTQRLRNSLGAIVQFQNHIFDELGRLLKTISALGQTTSFAYDAQGNQISIQDQQGAVTSRAFDGLKRLITVTSAINEVTTFSYDAQDNLISVSDPRNLLTSYVYDGFGRLIQESSPDKGTTVFILDLAGNRITETDARGVVTNRSFDKLNRVTSETFPASGAENITYTYDSILNGNFGIGRLTGFTDESGWTALKYDQRGNTVEESKTIGTQSYLTSYAYDLADRLTEVIYPSGHIIKYGRDPIGQLSYVTYQPTLSSVGTQLADRILYQPYGPLSALRYGNSLARRSAFNKDYTLRHFSVRGPSSIVQELSLRYDKVGNIAAIQDSINSSLSKSFQYDQLYRLKNVNGQYGTISYSYDPNGNRLNQTVNGLSEIYSYSSSSNRLLNLTSPSDSRNLVYDSAGNITNDDRGSAVDVGYIYSNRNRYKELTLNGLSTASYFYNGLGQRVVKNLASPASSTHFHYDIFGNLIAESDAGGSTLREYIWLADMPLAQIESSGAIYYIHPDHLNTPEKITDSSGSLVWNKEQKPFGETTSLVGALTNNLRFPGQFADNESGLNYNYFRDYDPSIGRYIQADPIGLSGASAVGMNLYGYANQNTLRYTDPKGLFAQAAALPHIIRLFRVLSIAQGTALSRLVDLPNLVECLSNNRCDELTTRIQLYIEDLKKRYKEMLEDDQELYKFAKNERVPGYSGTWKSHQEHFVGQQLGLLKAMEEAKQEGCPIPDEAEEWLNKFPPSTPEKWLD